MDLISIIAFLAGCIIGATSCFFVIRQIRNESTIERQLRELQEEFTAYRENVNQHFNQTAKLVNSLTNNYLAVQKHLEDAAESFSQPPKSFDLDESDKDNLPEPKPQFVSLELQNDPASDDSDAELDELAGREAPKDYAPRARPEDKGTLAEDYGLHDNNTPAR